MTQLVQQQKEENKKKKRLALVYYYIGNRFLLGLQTAVHSTTGIRGFLLFCWLVVVILSVSPMKNMEWDHSRDVIFSGPPCSRKQNISFMYYIRLWLSTKRLSIFPFSRLSPPLNPYDLCSIPEAKLLFSLILFPFLKMCKQLFAFM